MQRSPSATEIRKPPELPSQAAFLDQEFFSLFRLQTVLCSLCRPQIPEWLCSWGWPLTPGPPASKCQVLGWPHGWLPGPALLTSSEVSQQLCRWNASLFFLGRKQEGSFTVSCELYLKKLSGKVGGNIMERVMYIVATFFLDRGYIFCFCFLTCVWMCVYVGEDT